MGQGRAGCTRVLSKHNPMDSCVLMEALCANGAFLFSSTTLGITLLLSAGLCGYHCDEYSTDLKVDSILIAAL